MVKLGMLNSRMKDFFDLWTLSREFSFDGSTLSKAAKTTFETRGTLIPTVVPLALTSEFYDDQQKNDQWKLSSTSRALMVTQRHFQKSPALHEFLMPVSDAVAKGESLNRTWPLGGPRT